ncbi:MAG: hypothetical protein OXI61_11675 [Candidatus Poribacteria bacterium]|nr:hypothetical protein [Candidatus Poribacteria bacterium]
MRIKYPKKAARWQPQYVGFDVKQVEIDVDTRIFPLPVIERTVSMLIDQIESIEAEEHDSSQLTIHLSFFSNTSEQEIEDLFYSKLICAKVMILTFEKTKNLRRLFQSTARFATTAVQEEISTYRKTASSTSVD